MPTATPIFATQAAPSPPGSSDMPPHYGALRMNHHHRHMGGTHGLAHPTPFAPPPLPTRDKPQPTHGIGPSAPSSLLHMFGH